MTTLTPRLDDDTAAFIQQFVSINVATRNQENRPAISRAAGCRFTADGHQLSIFLTSLHNQHLLENIHANRMLAVVFSRPSTHQTIQLKGSDARILAVSAEDRPAIAAYRQSFMQEISRLGYPPAFCEAVIPPLDEHYVAIRFTPERAYSQTPGPRAGQKIAI
ncbi:MAG: hypothetical protein GC149_11860 [Gammaproteobacteria bacterium]|nr:hypothetical protein [Gammaproteobacteria bacterium]